MGDFPAQPVLSPKMLGTIGALGDTELGRQQNIIVSNCASAVYTLANWAIYVPFILERQRTVYQMATHNGTVVSGNFDLGIYDFFGTRLVSTGSTAQSGTSTIQVVNTTDLTLKPGTYFMAMACDNTTATFFRSTMALAQLASIGCKKQASAFPLPSTATFAEVDRAFCASFYLSLHPTIF